MDGGAGGAGAGGGNDDIDRKLFVGGLLPHTTQQTLHAYFQQFGPIDHVKLIVDKHSGRSKCYGFVVYQDPAGAHAAANNPYPILDGKSCNCNLAALNVKPQEQTKSRRTLKRAQPYGSGPSQPMEYSQAKRMKIDNNNSHAQHQQHPSQKVSYIQQLIKDGSEAPTKASVLAHVRELKSDKPIDAFHYLVEMWEVWKVAADGVDAECDAELKELQEVVRTLRAAQADEDGIAHDPEPAAHSGDSKSSSDNNGNNATGSSSSDNVGASSADGSAGGETGGSESGVHTAQDYADAYQDGYHPDEGDDEDHAIREGTSGEESFADHERDPMDQEQTHPERPQEEHQ